jgi:4-methyl-5(b-hydroxyethyl)-thiazole monophosphate biosynthesis
MKKVLLLLANGFETFEASVFIDVIGWNLIDGDCSTKLFSCGFNKEIKTSFNQRFVVDYLIDDIDVNNFDALAIPGGFEEYGFYKDAYDERFLNLIRKFSEQNKVIATICVAALSLGKSGVLKNRKGTTYNQNPLRQEQLRAFGVEVLNEPIVLDENIITSWNPSTAVDVALLLLELLTTDKNAKNIRKKMGFKNIKQTTQQPL